MVVLRGKQEGGVETRELKTRGLSINSISYSLTLNFLFTLPRCQVIFQWNQKKGKVTKCLKCVKEFSCSFDLANEKYLSVFLGVFAKIVKVIYFAQVITFPESTHGKVHPCKVDR